MWKKRGPRNINWFSTMENKKVPQKQNYDTVKQFWVFIQGKQNTNLKKDICSSTFISGLFKMMKANSQSIEAP